MNEAKFQPEIALDKTFSDFPVNLIQSKLIAFVDVTSANDQNKVGLQLILYSFIVVVQFYIDPSHKIILIFFY